MSDFDTFTILGVTDDGEVAWTWSDEDHAITANESELDMLQRYLQSDRPVLWPTRPCRWCETNAVVEIEGRPHCNGHAMAHGMAEDESQEAAS